MTNWNLMYDVKPNKPNSRFIALCRDGSGCVMFKIDKNNKFYDFSDKYEDFASFSMEKLDEYFLYWSYLPDDFKFWGEE